MQFIPIQNKKKSEVIFELKATFEVTKNKTLAYVNKYSIIRPDSRQP